SLLFLFITHPPTTDVYTLSLHDALPISGWHLLPARGQREGAARGATVGRGGPVEPHEPREGRRRLAAAGKQGFDAVLPHRRILVDRKSTRLNSSHVDISYAVFCLKKKNA